ncbi:MAG TPA: T9SS type A sorting domain-containing protein [Saprospiraceae bacterium]|nr:T9SS type A sorting domain-containing protein [Saprospiraceae bacterium]
MKLHIIVLFFFFIFSCTSSDKQNQSETNVKQVPTEESFLDRYGVNYQEYFDYKLKAVSAYQWIHTRTKPQNFPGQWTVQGPGNLGGRINVITVDPNNENTIYIGFASGGVYKSTDFGKTWAAIFDQQDNLHISCISVDPNNSKTVYVGTGDRNSGFYSFLGNGVYKSIDGGLTWKNSGLKENRIISSVVVDPKNSNVIYAAALGSIFTKNEHRGIYKSEDAGVNWTKVFYHSDSVGVSELIINPENPSILYAATWNRIGNNARSIISGKQTQLYRSIDGGLSWKMLEGGLPMDSINGRIALTIFPKNPKIVYARYNRSASCDGGPLGQQAVELYKTIDGGEKWSSINLFNTDLPCRALGGFGWYFNSIAVNPNNDKEIYLSGVDLFKSDNSGENWTLAAPEWWTYEVHADKHDLKFVEQGKSFLLATDGGLYHYSSSTKQWKDIENIPTNMCYRVAYNPHNSNLYYGGMQDNGSTGGNAARIDQWDRIFGGDGFQMAFHRVDKSIFCASAQNGNLYVTTDGGLGFEEFTEGVGGTSNWDMPYFISKFNPDKLILGTDKIYANDQFTAPQFYEISPSLVNGSKYAVRSVATISSIDESPLDENIIIAGVTNGDVWLTKDGASQWENIGNGLPAGYISSVKTSPSNTQTLYVTISAHRSSDFSPQVWKSTDFGKSWKSISSNLPSFPVFDVLVFPQFQDSILFVGNDIGVYLTRDAGKSWERMGDNMPIVPVYDLEFNEAKRQLVAATFGKSIQSFELKGIKPSINVATQNPKQIKKIELFPNPALNQVKMTTENSTASVTLYSLDGKPILKTNLTMHSLDISQLKSGQYIVLVESQKIPLIKL